MSFSTDMRFAIHRAIIIAIVATFASFSIIGILRSYSPIPPTYDDWVGYLGFYADTLDGKYSAWFTQYAMHRPILPRVLFWLDIRYFGGSFIFLIAANLITLCGVIAILITYLRRLTNAKCTRFVIGATISIIAVSWLQRPNLTSGFFGANWFMAMLLPLVAFYWLARAQEQRHFFWLALVAGFASAWTMGNGVLVLPLLATLALCIGLNPARIATLAIASAATIALYFGIPNYEQSLSLGAYWSTLTGDPGGAVQFALALLGNPFFSAVSYPLVALHHLFLLVVGEGRVSSSFFAEDSSDYPAASSFGFYITQPAGAALIVATTIIAWRWFASAREATRGALLAFLFFMIISAAACAAVRLTEDGVGASLQFRYTTLALLAWIALIVLGAPSYNLRRAVIIFACAAILLFPMQMLPVFGLKSVAGQHEHLRQAMQAILSGSDDVEALDISENDADPVRQVVRRLRGTKVSIFADGPMR